MTPPGSAPKGKSAKAGDRSLDRPAPITLSELRWRTPDGPEGGLKCPKCECRHLPVYYTRHVDGTVRRVRRCRHCGYELTTRERP
jgi:hypothetical protein